jgi:methylphosphotriester-DNA--protein-cysteine methyltransferase
MAELLGNRSTHIAHKMSCRQRPSSWVETIARKEAKAKGYRACSLCHPVLGAYVGTSYNAKILHLPDCSTLRGSRYWVPFETLQEATDSGYRSCTVCHPDRA